MKKYKNFDKLCLALDVDNASDALKYVKLLKDYVGLFKIGFQLFMKEGPKVVDKVINLGGKVFLDLKFHDIPNTVANASRLATKLGVNIFNLHSAGGSEMMRAAVEAANNESEKLNISPPQILAITLLTSIDDNILNKEICITLNANDTVIHFAKLAQSSGLSGVVASPKEASIIRENCGDDFVILTPGIRPSWSASKDDQKRITTPRQAIKSGANFIVVGRPILKADDPLKASEKILDEIGL